MVEFYDPIQEKNISYHLDKRMMKFLDDKVKDRIQKKDKDYVMLIDGYEGSGKSTAAQQWGKWVDPTLDLNRVCMSANEFKEAIINAKKFQCVIYDEAVTGLAAGESITRIGRLLKSMMMQMRQKNLFVIVILPTIFEFNKYAVLSRARSFFHIYEKDGRMGYWVGYNRKGMRLLYLMGKKTYSYRVRSRFIGRFYGKYVIDEELYRKKKADALFEIDDSDEGEYNKFLMERKLFLVEWFESIKESQKLNQKQFCEFANEKFQHIKGIKTKLQSSNMSKMVAMINKMKEI